MVDAFKIEKLATDIFQWLVKKEMWFDVYIYFNGKCWATSNEKCTSFCYNENKHFEFKSNPRDYFEYVGNPHILSMSFEGPLYALLNGYHPECANLYNEFNALFSKYGLSYELGDAWNLTAFEV